MKIRLEDIPEAGLALDLTEDGKAFDEIAGGKLDFGFASPVKARLDLAKRAGGLFITGDIKTVIRLACSRCLKEFDYPFEADFASYYERQPRGEREKELKAADMDVNFLSGDEVDTSEVILGQISLELPMQPLCMDACKGLCPRCGADLNMGACGCGGEDKTDPRLAKLKDFKAK